MEEDKQKQQSKANIRLALGLGFVALLAMLTTMYAMSGAKIPT